MAFIDGLPDDERLTMEQGFREHLSLAKLAPFIAKKFEGGPSWYSDPIIKAEALDYLKIVRPDFALSEGKKL